MAMVLRMTCQPRGCSHTDNQGVAPVVVPGPVGSHILGCLLVAMPNTLSHTWAARMAKCSGFASASMSASRPVTRVARVASGGSTKSTTSRGGRDGQ